MDELTLEQKIDILWELLDIRIHSMGHYWEQPCCYYDGESYYSKILSEMERTPEDE